MKSRLTPLGLALVVAGTTFAAFNPVPITPASFNADVVVEKTAPTPLSMATTATTDQGTNNGNNTWYEIGYNTAAPATGLPLHGSALTDTSGGNHHYVMPPDYTVNNVIMVGHHNGTGTAVITNGTLTLTTPAKYDHLSFLNSSGNGAVPVNYVIHYADSTTEAGVPFSSFDWQNTTAAANAAAVYNPAGRVSISGGGFANVDNTRATNAARLFFTDVAVGNPAVNITSIEFTYAGTAYNNGRACIFAVAGSTDGGTVYNAVAVTGFNYDVILEAGGPTNVAFPVGVITATMDGGTNLTGNTWYEQGYFARFPTSGLPPAGSTFTSAWLPSAQYTMPASYAAKNAAMLDSSNTTANLTLATPAAYGALSFLVAGGNSATTLPCILQFEDGTSETNAITTTDWFTTTGAYAWTAYGRVNAPNRSINNLQEQIVYPPLDSRTIINPVPRLFDAVIAVANNTGMLTNVLLIRTNAGGTSRAVVFALSGAPAGNLPPVLSAQPAGVKNWAGSNIVLSAAVGIGTAPISYQWKRAPKGGGVNNIFDYSTFANVTDGGNVSGATASSLTISNASTASSGDYFVIASNSYGMVTSFVATVTVLSTNQTIPAANDPVTSDPPGIGAPAAESLDHAIDRVAQKWLSYGLNNQAAPWTGPVGFIVTPSSGASILSSIRFYSANDTTGRDPTDYTLEGSNDDGVNWTLITGGVLKGTLALPTGRNGTGSTALNPLTQNVQEVDFANAAGYRSYRFSITNNYTPNNQALMQIGEIELLGTLVPNPPTWARQPASAVTVYVGASPTFGVAAGGYPPPTYQWKTNGTSIPGATNSTYTFPSAQLGDSGRTFSCTASNVFGTINSSSALLQVIAAPSGTYPTAILADSPIALFRLGEGPDDGTGNNGKVANDYRGGHLGQYTNAILGQAGFNPTVDSDTAAQFGVFALSDSYVGSIQDLNFAAPTNTTVNFSIEAWVNGPAQNVDAGIVTKGFGGGGEQFNLDTGGANRGFRFFFRDAGGATHGANAAAPLDGKWHHVVGVCNQANSDVVLYVDGLQVATGVASPSNGVLSTASPVSIGARQSGTTTFNNQFNGVIDEVAIYNYALSPSQVLNHFYAAHLPPTVALAPTNTTANEGGTVTFYSSAYGPSALSYQWYNVTAGEPGTLMAGQTSSNLVLAVTAALNGNSYRVVVTNAYGSVTSPPTSGTGAMLSVNSGPPAIIADLPAQFPVYAGRTANLVVGVAGTEPISYQWRSNGVNMADGGRISGTHSNVLSIAIVQPSDSANYQVVVSGAQGTPVSSSVSALVVLSVPMFNTDGTGWGLNGVPGAATISGDVLTMSTGAGGTRRSAFYSYPLYIGAFSASFTYQDVSTNGADGIAFVLHNDPRGTTALGGGGGELGYSGITPSVALELNIFNNSGIAFRANGATGTYDPTTPVNLRSGNPIDVSLTYGSGVLSVVLSNTVTSGTFTTNYNAGNLPAALGADTAYVGFTGADGGVTSTQQITKFQYIPYTTLAGQLTAPNAFQLSWPASVGGYSLQSTPNLTGANWQPVGAPITQASGQNRVIVLPTGDQFFRLVLPIP